VRVINAYDLVASLEENSFQIEERWRPNNGKAHTVIIVARKVGN